MLEWKCWQILLITNKKIVRACQLVKIISGTQVADLKTMREGNSNGCEALYCALALVDETKNTAKAWKIRVQGSTITRSWGRIGAKERIRTTTLESNENALKVARAMIRRKLRKGYTLVRKEGIL